MQRWHRLFDDPFDDVCRFELKGFIARLMGAVLTGALMGVSVGAVTAAVWSAAFALCEAAAYATTRPIADGRSAQPGQRLAIALAHLGNVCVWTAVAVIYWLSRSPALQFVAVCLFTGILISAPIQTARSLTATVIRTAPPLVAFAVLPIFFGGFHGVGLFMVCTTTPLITLHLMVGVAAQRQAAANLAVSRHEAVAASQAKSTFLAMMSHEIRTPMNGVLGMAHALTLGPLDDEQRRQVEMLTRSGDGLMAILNDILDLSKIEAGTLALDEQVFDLHDVVACVVDLWSASASEKGLTLAFEIAPAVPQWVRGDCARVRQILLNHLSNAVKFTEAGGIAISVAATAGGEVLISIRDTGIGLTERQCDGLFQPFSQADASITRRFGGSGLGLSINRQLAKLMGGDITVESAPGAGSAFHIVLRLPPAQEPNAEKAAATYDLAGLRVLVAEDNLINQAVVQAVLGAIGATVDLAADGAEALRLLQAGDYDLVLMDIHMPTMDGIEALRRIRAGEAGAPDQPVIALTADAVAGNARRFIALGFDAVESKPVQPAKLIAAIGEVCAGLGPHDVLPVQFAARA